MRGEGFNFVMGEVVIRWGRDVDDFQWAELILGGIWCRDLGRADGRRATFFHSKAFSQYIANSFN